MKTDKRGVGKEKDFHPRSVKYSLEYEILNIVRARVLIRKINTEVSSFYTRYFVHLCGHRQWQIATADVRSGGRNIWYKMKILPVLIFLVRNLKH